MRKTTSRRKGVFEVGLMVPLDAHITIMVQADRHGTEAAAE